MQVSWEQIVPWPPAAPLSASPAPPGAATAAARGGMRLPPAAALPAGWRGPAPPPQHAAARPPPAGAPRAPPRPPPPARERLPPGRLAGRQTVWTSWCLQAPSIERHRGLFQWVRVPAGKARGGWWRQQLKETRAARAVQHDPMWHCHLPSLPEAVPVNHMWSRSSARGTCSPVARAGSRKSAGESASRAAGSLAAAACKDSHHTAGVRQERASSSSRHNDQLWQWRQGVRQQRRRHGRAEGGETCGKEADSKGPLTSAASGSSMNRRVAVQAGTLQLSHRPPPPPPLPRRRLPDRAASSTAPMPREAAAGPQLAPARLPVPPAAGSTSDRYATCGTMAHPVQPAMLRHSCQAPGASQPAALAVFAAAEHAASSAAAAMTEAGTAPCRKACKAREERKARERFHAWAR